MNILVVDDEFLALTRLTRMLEELGHKNMIFENPKEALEHTSKEYFDVALLDINMPQMNGKELALELLKTNPDIFIIFQSAYEEHALEAFKIGAIDYLLKPFSKEQLQSSLKRASEYRQERKKRFLVRCDEDSILLEDSEILYIEASLSEVIIRTREGFFYYKEKISDIEKELPKNFFKIHRSIIINLDKIKNFRTLDQSRLEFSFKDVGDVVVSSKDGAKKFREFF